MESGGAGVSWKRGEQYEMRFKEWFVCQGEDLATYFIILLFLPGATSSEDVF